MKKKKRSGHHSSSSSRGLDTQSQDDKLKRSIIKTRNIIRKKFRDLHNQKQSVNQAVSETLQPIIEPLESIAKREKGEAQKDIKPTKSVKIEAETPGRGRDIFRIPDSVFKTALASHRTNLFDISQGSASSRGVHDISGISPLADELSAEEALEEDIIKKVGNLRSPHIDRTYGFKYKDGQLKLGNDNVITKSTPDGIVYAIRKKQFPATPGVTELLLSDKPKQFKKEDLQIYKDMLHHTSAHRKNYKKNGEIIRVKSSTKYNDILSLLFPPKEKEKKGGGFKRSIVQLRPQTKYKVVNKKTGNGANYTYWDDPNELVDRLRLLMSSQAAGHTGHDNEIISIVEELREAKIIN